MSQLFPNNTDFSPEDFIGLLNLTTRSFNALTRAGIQTVGEVAQLVESGELQTIPALGEKCISEIEDKVAQVKFNGSKAGSLAKADEIPMQANLYLSREDAIETLSLTRRASNSLTSVGVGTVGEVARLVESGRLRTIRGIGSKCVSEIEKKLAQVKFDVSEVVTNTDVIPRQVIRWQSQLVRKQLSSGLLHEEAIFAEKSIKNWLAEIEAIEIDSVYEVLATILGSSLNICEEIEFFLNQIPGQHRIAILLSTYGLEPQTMKQTSGELGISRGRVSQINSRLKDKLNNGIQVIVEARSISDLKEQSALLRMQSALLIAEDLELDITYEEWTQRIRSSGLVGGWISQEFADTDPVEVMIAICNLLTDCERGTKQIYSRYFASHQLREGDYERGLLQMPENLQYAVQLAAEGKPNVPAKILHALETLPDEVERLINGHTKNSGGVHVKWLSQESGMELEDIKAILHWRGYRALSEDWFIPNLSQILYYDVFHRCLRKMFQYCGPLAIDDVCSGLRHTLSERKFPVPSPDVMDEIVRIHGYKCEDGLYYWDGRSNENLNESETVIMNCLERIGPVLRYSELIHAFIESGLSVLSVPVSLQRSPLFERIELGLYKLRGRKVTYQDIERAKAAEERQSLRPEIEYDTNGNIIVGITLSAIAVGSGTILCEQFPDLSGEDWKCYAHGEEADKLNATENEFRRLKKTFELLNCQPGDRLKLIFNTWKRTVTIERVGADAQE